MKRISIIFILLFQLVALAVQAQSIVSILPATGTAGQTVSVTIQGSGTSFGPGTQVVLNQGSSVITATDISIISATKLTAKLAIPANVPSGSYTLVTISGISFVQLPNAFTVTGGGGPAASLVSVSPNAGNKGQTLVLNITGANTSFTQSSSTTVSLFASGTPIMASSVSALSNTRLSCTLNIPSGAASGLYSLVVNTSNDGTLFKAQAFTVNGSGGNTPALTAISPSTGARGRTLDVTISGTNTQFSQASVTVALFGSGSPITANYAFATSNTEIVANISIPANAPSGLRDVGVLTSNQGILELINGFTITGPYLLGATPGFGNRGQTLDVTITGSGTSFAQASSSLMVSLYKQATAIQANSVNALSDSQLVANFTIPSPFSTGFYNIGVYSGIDGNLELVDGFTILPTGVAEWNKPQPLKTYPNPVRESLTFESVAGVKEIMLMDIAGKQIRVPMNDVTITGEHNYSFSISTLQLHKGIYFLRLETDQGPAYQKILVE